MVNKKDLVIVALATFCLTATIFMVIPTKSGPGSEYNPWADVNDDGTVDIYDAIGLANSFGGTGVNPRNVTVRDGSFTWTPDTLHVEPFVNWSSLEIGTSGYTQITYRVRANASVGIWLHTFLGNSDIVEYINYSWENAFSQRWLAMTYKVRYTSAQFSIWGGNCTAYVDFYVCLDAIPLVDFPPNQDVTATITNWSENHDVASSLDVNITWSDYGASWRVANPRLGDPLSFMSAGQHQSRMAIQISVHDWHPYVSGFTSICADGAFWHVSPEPYSYTGSWANFAPFLSPANVTFYMNTASNASAITLIPIEMLAPFLRLNFRISSNVPSGWLLVDIWIYARNE